LLSRATKDEYKGILIDPTPLNDERRLDAFLKGNLQKEYNIGISSDIYHLIKEEKWKDLSEVLASWEWNVRRARLIEWHRSERFYKMCRRLAEVVSPCTSIMAELTEEEKSLFSKVSEMIGPASPRMVEMAKELIMTSVAKKYPILSYTRHSRNWFKKCGSVVLLQIHDARNMVHNIKKNIKTKIRDAGWTGLLLLYVFGLVADRLLEAFPQPIPRLLGYLSAGGLIVAVIADGTEFERCHSSASGDCFNPHVIMGQYPNSCPTFKPPFVQ